MSTSDEITAIANKFLVNYTKHDDWLITTAVFGGLFIAVLIWLIFLTVYVFIKVNSTQKSATSSYQHPPHQYQNPPQLQPIPNAGFDGQPPSMRPNDELENYGNRIRRPQLSHPQRQEQPNNYPRKESEDRPSSLYNNNFGKNPLNSPMGRPQYLNELKRNSSALNPAAQRARNNGQNFDPYSY